MKILQTPARFYPFVGGVENYVYNLSRELVKLGHEVTVVCANEPRGKTEELIEGIKVRRIPYVGKIANTNITPRIPIEILKEDFDIIHTHLPTPWSSDWSGLLTRMRRKPLILTYHNDIVAEGRTNHIAHLYNHTGLKFLLKRAEKIIITQENYLRTSPYLKGYENKISVLPLGVSSEKFKPMELEKINNSIFFLSVLDGFHKYKGLDHLLRALILVKEKIPDVKLIVGGDGNLRSYYQRLSDDLGLEENVEFLGHVPDDMLAKYYNGCEIFVLPSVSSAQEGFGMVLLEAMACGKPVVSTRIVGVATDIMEIEGGIIIDPGNEVMLSDSILRLLRNRELAAQMGKNGRALVLEKYGWEGVARKVEGLYLEEIN